MILLLKIKLHFLTKILKNEKPKRHNRRRDTKIEFKKSCTIEKKIRKSRV